jgi:hypothetical protein
LAGRPICLLAMAVLADEDALAHSQRSFHHPAFHGPWAARAARDLEELVRERIPEGRLPALDARLAERASARQHAAALEQRQARAREQLAEQLDGITELSQTELEGPLALADEGHGRYSPEASRVRDAVTAELERRSSSAESRASDATGV